MISASNCDETHANFQFCGRADHHRGQAAAGVPRHAAQVPAQEAELRGGGAQQQRHGVRGREDQSEKSSFFRNRPG